MRSDRWSDSENDSIVASYFMMLSDDLSGRAYNKAALNRDLQDQTGRSRGSIEFKLCNISAACLGFGLPIIKGYKPRFNFQMTLAEAISRWLVQHPEWELCLHRGDNPHLAETGALFIGMAPQGRKRPPSEEDEQIERVARRFNIAERDERNRALGQAGEERVFHHERMNLQQYGRDDLARRVRWVSREDGDGAGYDIASFTADGRERLIEVKTTNGWERTPFHISRNELEVAQERRDDWFLFRLYEFARGPKAFELRPPLETHISLTATNFQAHFQ